MSTAKQAMAKLLSGQIGADLNTEIFQENVNKTSRPQENKSPREQDLKNARDTENKNSREQELRVGIRNPTSSEKAADGKIVIRHRKSKKTVDKSRLVESDGIRRFPVNLTMREDYHIALKVLAAQRQVQMWTLLDEAIGRYLSSEK